MDADQGIRTGGCLCGQVRYRITGAPLFVAMCHCRDCQKNTGSAFSVNSLWPESQVELIGQVATWEGRGGSGHPVIRTFCPACGTPLRSQAQATRGLFVLKSGTLDDPESVTPTVEMFCASEIRAWTAPRARHDRLPG